MADNPIVNAVVDFATSSASLIGTGGLATGGFNSNVKLLDRPGIAIGKMIKAPLTVYDEGSGSADARREARTAMDAQAQEQNRALAAAKKQAKDRETLDSAIAAQSEMRRRQQAGNPTRRPRATILTSPLGIPSDSRYRTYLGGGS